jgi:hypothetical protein
VEAVVVAGLRARPWECVVIGGGVRNEDQLGLFEQVLNLCGDALPMLRSRSTAPRRTCSTRLPAGLTLPDLPAPVEASGDRRFTWS